MVYFQLLRFDLLEGSCLNGVDWANLIDRMGVERIFSQTGSCLRFPSSPLNDRLPGVTELWGAISIVFHIEN